MWEIDVGAQVYSCMYSLALGALLCVFYDVIRAIRKLGFDSFVAVFAGDLLFWLVSAVTVFLFLMAVTNGEIRGYVLLFCAAGFLIYRFTVGKPAFLLFCFILSFIQKILNKFSENLRCSGKHAIRLSDKLLLEPARSVSRRLKKLLKSACNMLYTEIHKEKTEFDADE